MSAGALFSSPAPLPANHFRQGNAFAAFARNGEKPLPIQTLVLPGRLDAIHALPIPNAARLSVAPLTDTLTRSQFQKPGAFTTIGNTHPEGLLLVASPPLRSDNASLEASRVSQGATAATNAPNNPDVWKRVGHVAKALGFFAAVLMLRKFPKGEVAKLASYRSTLIPSDWKEWAKVGLGIAGMSQVNQAANWKPPVWLNAMMNVAVVSPLVSGLTRQHFVQGAILAPVVGALAQATHYISDKAQKPLQEKWNIPPIVSHAVFSVLMVLASLRIFPWINSSIPPLQASADGSAVKTAMASACVNGCCSSVICVNDIGQLLAALSRSLFGADKETTPNPVDARKQGLS